MTLDKNDMDQDELDGYAEDTGGINQSSSKEFSKENKPKETPFDGRQTVQIERKESSSEINDEEPDKNEISYLQSNKTACPMRVDWKLVIRRKSSTLEQSAQPTNQPTKKKGQKDFQ
ncbi:Hypothetical protein FKW44_003374 [Caligus rogercresseyi]|uniref:Uncharacterized protein n=1 Tax=Caligus rogercresseyi TaxID=217165 RepID=A0A7T8KLW1_CALRO|nr:Hypothetical protein FKW44_003374 [Caligus rogercresseyi]